MPHGQPCGDFLQLFSHQLEEALFRQQFKAVAFVQLNGSMILPWITQIGKRVRFNIGITLRLCVFAELIHYNMSNSFAAVCGCNINTMQHLDLACFAGLGIKLVIFNNRQIALLVAAVYLANDITAAINQISPHYAAPYKIRRDFAALGSILNALVFIS